MRNPWNNNEELWDIKATRTGQNELRNNPRYDIDGQRYGNTLSDDMFSIKNPRAKNTHTPESYEYFNEPTVNEAPETMAPALGWSSVGVGQIPTLKDDFTSVLRKAMPKDYRERVTGRQKNVTDNGSGVHLYDEYEGWSLLDDILEFPENYTQEQLQWAEAQRNAIENDQKKYDLGTEGLREDMRYQREGGNRYSDMSSRRDAEWDPYIGDYVNYEAMSPRTMEMLAKMGVNRPIVEDDYSQRMGENGNDTYNTLLNLYRKAIENGWIK